MADLRKIQLFVLDIFFQINEICKKHDIVLFLDGGTLLGAVRHKGFIPWDDDMDFVMLRKDYNRFLKVAKKELKAPYFLQTCYTDKFYNRSFLHIRHSDSTAILLKKFTKDKLYNQGCFIDIFPLDAVLDEKSTFYKIQHFFLLTFENLRAIKEDTDNFKDEKSALKKKIKKIIKTIFPWNIIFHNLDFWYSFGNFFPCKYVGNIAYMGIAKKWRHRNIKDFLEPMQLEFEGKFYTAPNHYEDHLTKIYGVDFMTPKQTGGNHGEIFFDLKKPYTYYLEHPEEIEKILDRSKQ